jgi:hypothetical protein
MLLVSSVSLFRASIFASSRREKQRLACSMAYMRTLKKGLRLVRRVCPLHFFSREGKFCTLEIVLGLQPEDASGCVVVTGPSAKSVVHVDAMAPRVVAVNTVLFAFATSISFDAKSYSSGRLSRSADLFSRRPIIPYRA